MVDKGRHPKKQIAQVLADLPAHFEITEVHKGHRWGVVTCVECGDSAPIWSTPRVPEHHAKAIRRFAQRHEEHQ